MCRVFHKRTSMTRKVSRSWWKKDRIWKENWCKEWKMRRLPIRAMYGHTRRQSLKIGRQITKTETVSKKLLHFIADRATIIHLNLIAAIFFRSARNSRSC